jgi:hypothetical protein
MHLRLPLLASLLITAGAAYAAAATDYEIRLHRPATVGERFRETATASDSQRAVMRVDGVVARTQDDSITVEIVVDSEILAVTPKGRPAKVSLVIEKFVRTDGAGGEILAPGTAVVMERLNGKTVYTTGGQPVSRLAARAFDAAGVEVNGEENPTDDTVMGTKERKKVGDSWAIDAVAAAADLSRVGGKVDPSNVKGSVKVAELTKVDDQPVLRLTCDLAIDGASPPLPPGLELKKSAFRAEFSGLFPVDVTKSRVQESQSLTMDIEASGSQNGRTLEMTMSKKTARETKFSHK